MTDRTPEHLTDEDFIAEVWRSLSPPPPKRKRAKPNRCRGCGKVSRTIFCPECYRARHER